MNTNNIRYGVNHPYQNKNIINKVTQIKRNKHIKILNELLPKNIIIIKYDNSNNIKLKCNICNNTFYIQHQYINIRLKRKEKLCLYCNPIKCGNFSYKEKELLQFINDNYNKEIIFNSKKIIHPLELDIYLPDLKLAFEFNGLYWHSELHKPKNYHLDKTNLCESKDIHLIHIYEDDWIYKEAIVKSRIFNLLGRSERIFARKTIIREILSEESNIFLEENHIQGKVNSKIKVGLFYNDILVSLMTFGKARFHNTGYELMRFCNKQGYSVVGGANKLFKYFLNYYKPKETISYADRSWSRGNLYKQLNFKLIGKTIPNYYYIDNGIKVNRFKYRKSELIKQGYDKNKIEHKIMLEREIYRIYDSGNLKYKYLQPNLSKEN